MICIYIYISVAQATKIPYCSPSPLITTIFQMLGLAQPRSRSVTVGHGRSRSVTVAISRPTGHLDVALFHLVVPVQELGEEPKARRKERDMRGDQNQGLQAPEAGRSDAPGLRTQQKAFGHI